MKRASCFSCLILCLSFLSVLSLSAQSIDDIKNSPDYLCGEGRGESLREADNEALRDLISKISVSVESDYSDVTSTLINGNDYNVNSAVKMVVNTYSQATLQNTERVVISDEPDAYVVRYVKRTDVEKIFEGRKHKLLDMVESAEKAERNLKIDDALRYYYWGYCLLQSLPNENEVVNNSGKLLVNYIPDRMNDIFNGLRINKVKEEDNYIDLEILYRGQPVTSIDYTYFDGLDWSNLYSARDGKGVLEMRPGATTDNLRIKCEYEYAGEAHIDKEIANVVSIMKGKVFRGSNLTVSSGPSSADDSGMLAAASTSSSTTESAADISTPDKEEAPITDFEKLIPKVKGELKLLTDEEAAPYDEVIKRIIAAIQSKQYSSVDDCFTDDGKDIFNRLVHYGNARIVGKPQYSFFTIGTEEVTCRSIPMNFSFKGNGRQFVENITFTFNTEGKVDCLAFGLDEKAAEDILHHAKWGEEARKILTEFLENYKTAYSLKRLDYLKQIFDENAVIITGKVVKKAPPTGDNQTFYADNKFVELTRQTKQEYMRNLERSFNSKEFINIRFAENDVVKAGRGGEIYGIQIRQDYYSNNYGDTGYLFLMVDLNDPKNPIIKVRVWNPERDPDFKGVASF